MVTSEMRPTSKEARIHPTDTAEREFLSTIPRGDGHTILLIPGFLEPERQLHLLQDRLSSIGYGAQIAALGGINIGTPLQEQTLIQEAQEIIEKKGDVSMIGHSLGGRMAVLASLLIPIRKVVTLGSPILDIPSSNTNLLAISGSYDSIIPPFLAFSARKPHRVVPSGHMGMVISKDAFRHVGNFLAA